MNNVYNNHLHSWVLTNSQAPVQRAEVAAHATGARTEGLPALPGFLAQILGKIGITSIRVTKLSNKHDVLRTLFLTFYIFVHLRGPLIRKVV